MTNYQYPQQLTGQAQLGTPAVPSVRQTGFSQPIRESPSTGRLPQQPSVAGTARTVETGQPTRQATAQNVGQPTQQQFGASPIEPQAVQGFAEPQLQPRQFEAPTAQRVARPVTQSQAQLRQVEAPTSQRLTQPTASTRQRFAGTELSGQQVPLGTGVQQFPAGVGVQQPTTESSRTLPFQQAPMQAAASQAPSGVQFAGGAQTAGVTQPTGGQQAMAVPEEFGVEQQAELQSLAKGMPAVDIYEKTDELVIFADVPGCEPENIELVGNENSVTLVAERGESPMTDAKNVQRECVKQFERTLPLPARADIDEAEATVENGVCRITLPKNEDDREKRIGFQ